MGLIASWATANKSRAAGPPLNDNAMSPALVLLLASVAQELFVSFHASRAILLQLHDSVGLGLRGQWSPAGPRPEEAVRGSGARRASLRWRVASDPRHMVLKEI